MLYLCTHKITYMKRFLPHLIAFFFVLHLSPLGDALAFGACMCWAFYSLFIIGTVLILYGMYLVNSKRPKLSV